MAHEETLARLAAELAQEAARAHADAGIAAREDPVWDALRATGSELWLDTGDIDAARALWNRAFSGLTTNNTLLNAEVQKGIYDDLVRRAAEAFRSAHPGIDPITLVIEVAFVLNACHGLRLARDFGARVSVELHTDLAHDRARTVAYAQRYHAISPERFYVKVPLTPAGYLAARDLSGGGVPINFTLGFSARQNHLAALLSGPDCLNVFVGRINAFVADNGLGDGRLAGEKAALAAQRAVRRLRDGGRTRSRLIGASLRSGAQIAYLAGLDILTMPPKAAEEYRAEPPREPCPRIDEDPDVPWAEGADPRAAGLHTLWEVDASFLEAADELLSSDPGGLTPEDLTAHFRKRGAGGLFPNWSADDVRRVRAEGKIPRLATWLEGLASGRIGLDALLNLAGLESFAKDQEALDARIRGLIGL